jgi:catechol 2,3-dioxygenase-like lactoylglutathione lyase family enzyme
MTVATVLGVHHTGATVRDLHRSLAWWKAMFDVEPQVLVENAALSPEICEAIGVPATVMSYAFLPVGGGLVELLEYHDPVGSDFALSNKDVGAMHIAVRVDDVPAQYEHMVSEGATFRHPPIVLDGDLEGVAFAYAIDPDGLQVEIWQEP